MSLFEHNLENRTDKPLAEVLRPQTIDEFVGQEQLWQRNSQLLAGIKKGQFPNLILWGPPGCGKTSLARVIRVYFKGRFLARNAVDTGAKELREIGIESRQWLAINQEPTLLFIDEIHRLNKAQQDVLLPHVESGDFKLIGATTENPSYSLNNALLSRCKLVVFDRLSEDALAKLIERVSNHHGWTLESFLTKSAQKLVLQFADGDGRRLIQAIDELALARKQDLDLAARPLTDEDLGRILGDTAIRYDRTSDEHYDIISAFIKSVRGSDADAAIYWLARMIKGGEDPMFIARRLIILASEDIGNADPRALSVAVNGAQALEMIGMPEGGITLAQVTTYLASCPKSNRSYQAWNAAKAEVENSGTLPVSMHLRSSKRKAMVELGYGKGYKYPHDHSRAWIHQEYLPEALAEKKKNVENGELFYHPVERGFEKSITEYLKWLKQT